jgi:hypothetical protein
MSFNFIHLHCMCNTLTVYIIHCVPVLNEIDQPNNIALQILQPWTGSIYKIWPTCIIKSTAFWSVLYCMALHPRWTTTGLHRGTSQKIIRGARSTSTGSLQLASDMRDPYQPGEVHLQSIQGHLPWLKGVHGGFLTTGRRSGPSSGLLPA